MTRDALTRPPSLAWSAACARRARRQGLLTPLSEAGPAETARAMCGAHAQVLSAAELSVGMRMAAGTRTDVRRALWDERSLVKTYGPRGTVHLLPTRDLPMWTGALSAVPGERNVHAKDVRLTEEQTDEVVHAIAEALEDAELTVDELTEEIVARTGAWAGDLVMPAFQSFWPRWRQAMYPAAIRGALCFGPNRGRKVTYTNPRRWLPGFRPDDGRTALAALVTSYLHAYGPASPQHFAQWLAGPRGWAGELFDTLTETGVIERVELDGALAWQVAGDSLPEQGREPGPKGLRLLPYFDAYTIASHPRERVFPGRAAERALNGGQAGAFPVLLIDGVAAGVWHQRRSGRKLAITVEPLETLSTAHREELSRQVARVGEVLEATPELTVGTVSVGAHA